jgi:hypothetical protein
MRYFVFRQMLGYLTPAATNERTSLAKASLRSTITVTGPTMARCRHGRGDDRNRAATDWSMRWRVASPSGSRAGCGQTGVAWRGRQSAGRRGRRGDVD